MPRITTPKSQSAVSMNRRLNVPKQRQKSSPNKMLEAIGKKTTNKAKAQIASNIKSGKVQVSGGVRTRSTYKKKIK
jgi:hypothetical protein